MNKAMDKSQTIMEVAYGIYQGCIFEGGGIGKFLYKDKGDAIAEAVRIFEAEIIRDKEYRKLDEEDEDFEEMSNYYEQFKWRKCDKKENRWHNTVDEIEIIEYEIR